MNFSNFPIRTAKFSASGSELMAGSNNHPHYFVFDLMLGRTTKVPWGQNSGEHTSGNFDISPDGKLIAFVGRFGMLHLVSARSKELLHSFKANENISAVSFSRDSGAVYRYRWQDCTVCSTCPCSVRGAGARFTAGTCASSPAATSSRTAGRWPGPQWPPAGTTSLQGATAGSSTSTETGMGMG